MTQEHQLTQDYVNSMSVVGEHYYSDNVCFVLAFDIDVVFFVLLLCLFGLVMHPMFVIRLLNMVDFVLLGECASVVSSLSSVFCLRRTYYYPSRVCIPICLVIYFSG